MDFEQDESYIEASFMSDYQIDLSSMNMHWWRFCTLISGLTEKCILNQIRSIRNYDLNDLHDQKSNELPRGVYSLDYLPVLLEWPDVALTGLCAMLLCFLATLYPARQAARLEPVDALRYE